MIKKSVAWIICILNINLFIIIYKYINDIYDNINNLMFVRSV